MIRLLRRIFFRVRTRRLRMEIEIALAMRRRGRTKRQAAARKAAGTRFRQRIQGARR